MVWRVNWVWDSNNWVTCTVSGSSGWVSLASAWKAFLAMLLRRLIPTEVWLLPLGTIGCGSKFPWYAQNYCALNCENSTICLLSPSGDLVVKVVRDIQSGHPQHLGLGVPNCSEHFNTEPDQCSGDYATMDLKKSLSLWQLESKRCYRI